jgi:1,4-dihydroxy-2-naphthoyl-CoA synthase
VLRATRCFSAVVHNDENEQCPLPRCVSSRIHIVQVVDELVTAAEAMDADPAVRVIIITGDGPKAFAAGADIKEMSTLTYSEVYQPGPATERLKLSALYAATPTCPPSELRHAAVRLQHADTRA